MEEEYGNRVFRTGTDIMTVTIRMDGRPYADAGVCARKIVELTKKITQECGKDRTPVFKIELNI